MRRKLMICLFLALAIAVPALAEEKGKEAKNGESEAKELSGMSIVGNDEAPKSLYIVPWKSSELGIETGLSLMLNNGNAPVDRDVFQRQLDFYEVASGR
ncbi:MAG: hypothetical protein R2940_17400 [Syntrophotaleaceae bacterium]